MPFHDFRNLDGTPNADALLEQATIVSCLYWNDQAQAIAAIAACGGGSITGWNFTNDSFPPSIVVWTQGDNIFVVVTGTVNLLQAFADINGAFAHNTPLTNNMRHAFFEAQSLLLKDRIIALLPAGWQTKRLHFCGHSLGASILFLFACDLKTSQPTLYIEYLGLAQPKAMTLGYTGQLPDVCINVISVHDVIGRLPPSVNRPNVLAITAHWFSGIPVDWSHFGEQYLLKSDAQLTPATAELLNGPVQIGWISDTFTEHPMGNYATRIKTLWLTDVGFGQNLLLLPIIDAVIALPAVQNFNVDTHALQAINVPEANALLFLQPVGGPLNNANLPLVNNIAGQVRGLAAVNPIFSPLPSGGAAMDLKVTYFFHDNLGGFSESFYLPGKDFVTFDAPQVAAYVDWRLQFSGIQTIFDYARASDAANPRNVRVFSPQDCLGAPVPVGWAFGQNFVSGFASGLAAANGESDYASTAFLIRRISGAKFSNMWLRGMCDFFIKAGGVYSPNAKGALDVQAYFNHLQNNGYNWKTVTGNFNPPAFLTAAVNNGDLTAHLTLDSNLFAGLAVNKHVVVRVTGQTTPKNLNGQFTVAVGPTPNVCNTVKFMPIVGFVAGIGKMTLKATGFAPINSCKVIKVSSRKAGRPFGVLVGRSKNRKAG